MSLGIEEKRDIKFQYEKYGYFAGLRYIFFSEKVSFLRSSLDSKKALELLMLCKADRSTVEFLKYEAKNDANVRLYNNITYNDGTNVTILSPRSIKYQKQKIRKLPADRLLYLKSFIDVLPLKSDNTPLSRLIKKVRKVRTMYKVQIPYCRVDFDIVSSRIQSLGLKVSSQDVAAFLSVVNSLSGIGISVNIPSSFWIVFFGKRKVKEVKKIFHDLGILTILRNYIAGFRSSHYKISLCGGVFKDFEVRDVCFDVTSINTLVKLSKLKRLNGRFSLKDKIRALEYLEEVITGRFKDKINLTNVFLYSRWIQFLQIDFSIMDSYLLSESYVEGVFILGKRLSIYMNKINSGHEQYYYPINEKST